MYLPLRRDQITICRTRVVTRHVVTITAYLSATAAASHCFCGMFPLDSSESHSHESSIYLRHGMPIARRNLYTKNLWSTRTAKLSTRSPPPPNARKPGSMNRDAPKHYETLTGRRVNPSSSTETQYLRSFPPYPPKAGSVRNARSMPVHHMSVVPYQALRSKAVSTTVCLVLLVATRLDS